MRGVLLFGTAWIACLAAIMFVIDSRERPRVSASVSTHVRSTPSLPPHPSPRVGARYPGWTVTRSYSAHHMMVVVVETDRPATGPHIARQLVEPLKDYYDEVLIYVRTPGRPADELAARRIQWTKRNGYVEMIYKSER